MEDGAVIMAGINVVEKIGDGLWCVCRIQFDFDVAMIGSKQDGHGIPCVKMGE
jgi:hypothetical protein